MQKLYLKVSGTVCIFIQTCCLSQTDRSVTHAPEAERQTGRPLGVRVEMHSRPLIFNVPLSLLMRCMSRRESDLGDQGTHSHPENLLTVIQSTLSLRSPTHTDSEHLKLSTPLLTLHPTVSSLSLFVYFPTHSTYSYAYTQTYTPLHMFSRKKKTTALGLKSQFPSLSALLSKKPLKRSNTSSYFLCSFLSWSQVPLTHRCSFRAHLGSAFKEPTCNWGYKSCS